MPVAAAGIRCRAHASLLGIEIVNLSSDDEKEAALPAHLRHWQTLHLGPRSLPSLAPLSQELVQRYHIPHPGAGPQRHRPRTCKQDPGPHFLDELALRMYAGALPDEARSRSSLRQQPPPSGMPPPGSSSRPLRVGGIPPSGAR